MQHQRSNIKKTNSFIAQAIDHLPNYLPVVIIFMVVVLTAVLLNFYHVRNHAMADGKASIAILENHINKISDELRALKTQVSDSCTTKDKLALRSYAFHSEMLKEVGMYRDNYVICTSNEGKTKIKLYNSVLDRIYHSPSNTTISLTESKSKLQTFFVYASEKEREGINALMPPKQFIQLVEPLLAEQNYGYRIQVLDQSIISDAGSMEDAHTLFSFSSHLYPLSITIYLNATTFQHHFFEHIWQAIFIASALSVVYLLIRYQTLAKRSMEFSLLSAIENDQIELYLQPIVDSNDHTLSGCEALVRWNHPSQGQISPDIFIPLAEKLGVIDVITKNTLDSVASFLYRNKKLLKNRYISVNISRTLIIDNSFIQYLQDFAKKHPKLVSKLLLEITENVEFSADELEEAVASLKELHASGYQIAIDDFGTGYSGLNFIHLHPFNVMKIDKVFIKSLHAESSITPVLVSMIQLAKQLDMKVIAEGVETEQQLSQLNELGVRYIQGFYYSQAIKPEEVTAMNFRNSPMVSEF
ncbi:EAL domain-containing protein [Vibrio sp. TRT 21S02]|uniref:EAL domain-containing protein n=1 Tax=Vibrio sp. TRT 21S02 TaxID=3418507 RepID=UPI003CF3B1C0